MKLNSILAVLWIAFGLPASAFDPKEASTERFKVSYVEPEKIPEMKDLPEHYSGRDMAIKDDEAAGKRGESEKERLKRRQMHFRDAAYPIRVTDQTTGTVYQVESDRRTITATNLKGDVLWKVNPFVDAKLVPYRMKHPVIVYFGKAPEEWVKKEEPQLGLGFNSSQFGTLRLSDGKFTFHGQD